MKPLKSREWGERTADHAHRRFLPRILPAGGSGPGGRWSAATAEPQEPPQKAARTILRPVPMPEAPTTQGCAAEAAAECDPSGAIGAATASGGAQVSVAEARAVGNGPGAAAQEACRKSRRHVKDRSRAGTRATIRHHETPIRFIYMLLCRQGPRQC